MRRELGGTKKMLKAIAFQTILAWILACIVYQVGSRIEAGIINWANIIVVGIILAIVIFILLSKKGKTDECNNCPYCNSCSKK